MTGDNCGRTHDALLRRWQRHVYVMFRLWEVKIKGTTEVAKNTKIARCNGTYLQSELFRRLKK